MPISPNTTPIEPSARTPKFLDEWAWPSPPLVTDGAGTASFDTGWDMRKANLGAGCRRAVKTARVYTLSSQEREGSEFRTINPRQPVVGAPAAARRVRQGAARLACSAANLATMDGFSAFGKCLDDFKARARVERGGVMTGLGVRPRTTPPRPLHEPCHFRVAIEPFQWLAAPFPIQGGPATADPGGAVPVTRRPRVAAQECSIPHVMQVFPWLRHVFLQPCQRSSLRLCGPCLNST